MSAPAKKARRGYKLTPCGEIPQDWECVTLADVAQRFLNGGTPSLARPEYWGGKIPWITGAELVERRVSDPRRAVTDLALAETATNLVPCGSVMVATRTGMGKIAQAPYDLAISQDLTAIVVKSDRCDNRFLFEAVAYRLPDLVSKAQGSAIAGILRDDLTSLEFALPKLPEQRRIAGILSDVAAAILLADQVIQKRRGLRFLTACRLIERGTSSKPKLGQRVGVTSWRFPASWELAALADVADVSSGVTLGRELSGDDVVELPYLRVANVQDGHLDLSELKTVEVRRSELPRFLLQPGDVLMNEGGDFDKLGRGAVWRGEVPQCLHQNHVFKVRANRERLTPEFLALVCESAYGKHFFRSNAKQTTNLASINSSQLKQFIIPLPSLDEQRRIVEHLDHWSAAIAAEELKLAALERVKAELARRLLTGELRVKS